jgi:glycosyltransferase involved in cell wall biosynthesis
LVKDKGIVEYVQAAQILLNNNLPVVCNVLGPVWDHNLKDNTVTREELTEWSDKGFINYLGDTKDVRPFIADADCIVLPSYREGTSNVLLEAGSMAKPCITCNTTGCKEIVEDQVTGFLCEVKNADDLARKMESMTGLSDGQREEMGNRARQKIIKEFDKQIVLDAYLNAIKKTLEK